MGSFFQDCGPAYSSTPTSTDYGEQCVTNFAKLIGVIMGVFVGLVLISAMFTCLRRRRSRTSLAKYHLAPLSAPVPWPSTQFTPAPAPPPPPVYPPPPSYQQPTAQLDNAFPSPAPAQSNNPFRRYPFTEAVSRSAAPEAQHTTSQALADDPYDFHAV
ncbi:hypothetical protein DFS33DRAFT_1281691, partial [Desarmillaria ectypa]